MTPAPIGLLHALIDLLVRDGYQYEAANLLIKQLWPLTNRFFSCVF